MQILQNAGETMCSSTIIEMAHPFQPPYDKGPVEVVVLSDRSWMVLMCPGCGGELVRTGSAIRCCNCDARYSLTDSGQPDLRLQAPKHLTLEVTVGEQWLEPDFEFGPIRANPSPGIDTSHVTFHRGLTFGNRLTPELASYFPRAREHGGFMLDLGCGGRDFADVCAQTNLEYVGMDYSGDKPDLLGDAHSLPFKNETFEFVLSMAVLEHLRHPLVAMSEVYRVMKPGALFIGTVAFLESFHLDSMYHHTHLGTYNSLASVGFEVCQIEANRDWRGPRAIAKMALFPGAPRKLTNLLVWPLEALSRAWCRLDDLRHHATSDAQAQRQLATAGGYRFIATKPASPSRVLPHHEVARYACR